MTADARQLPCGWSVIAHACVASTNDEAMALSRAGAPEGTIVQARRQESGRGRQGRRWVSEEGNLFCSTIIRPACPPPAAATLGFVAANAAAAAISVFVAAERVAIKWPNDILVDGRKISGILLEADIAPDGNVAAMIIGIGVNVRHAPELAAYPVTSLAAVANTKEVDADTVLEYLSGALHDELQVWRRDGFGAVRARWLSRCIGVGGTVSVRLGDRVVQGEFAGLDDDGALLLKRPQGTLRITAGDVLLPDASGG